jgi:hypothetical protein
MLKCASSSDSRHRRCVPSGRSTIALTDFVGSFRNGKSGTTTSPCSKLNMLATVSSLYRVIFVFPPRRQFCPVAKMIARSASRNIAAVKIVTPLGAAWQHLAHCPRTTSRGPRSKLKGKLPVGEPTVSSGHPYNAHRNIRANRSRPLRRWPRRPQGHRYTTASKPLALMSVRSFRDGPDGRFWPRSHSPTSFTATLR